MLKPERIPVMGDAVDLPSANRAAVLPSQAVFGFDELMPGAAAKFPVVLFDLLGYLADNFRGEPTDLGEDVEWFGFVVH